jgi:hypothetical protein
LPNQAHDSICGCSADELHRQMQGRYATATELADQTTSRVLERLAGLGPTRPTPWSTELDLAVFNPSPFPRTDVVRVALDGHPVYRLSDMGGASLLTFLDGEHMGYEVDGAPARWCPHGPRRMRMWEGCQASTSNSSSPTCLPSWGACTSRERPHPPRWTISHHRCRDLTVTRRTTARSRSWPAGGASHRPGTGDPRRPGDTYDFDPVAGDHDAGGPGLGVHHPPSPPSGISGWWSSALAVPAG